jgi:phage terminase large subunit-like protein
MLQINNYIQQVLKGDIVTGELIKLACQRHVNDLERSNTTDFPYYFDENYAWQIVQFCEIARHWKGEWAGTNIKLEPHQQFFFGSLFAWKHKETKYRRFRTSFKEMARKGAKTTEEALVAIIHFILDNEEGSQIYAGATKEEQAMIVVNDCGKIIQKTPEFRDHFKFSIYKDKIKRVIYPLTSSFFAPLGRDSKSEDGLDPSVGIIDEYHAHPDENIINVLKSGQGSRTQPLMSVITTAGFNKEYPCYKTMRKTAIDILRGIKKDETFFALIFEMDENDDWHDEKNWIKANPNIGVSVKWEFMRNRHLEAINLGGQTEVDFKTKNLNKWVDAPDVWIQDDKIKKIMMPNPDLKGSKGRGGLDIAGANDLNAFCFEVPYEGVFKNIHLFWCPETKVKNRDDKVDYATWVKDGWLRTTPGDSIDYRIVVADILNFCKVYRVESIAYDPMYASHNIIFDLIDEGIKMNPMGQGMKQISTPTKDFWKLVVDGVWHFENPIIRWMFANAYCYTDANDNWKLIKPANRRGTALKSSGKIDGLIASIMAHGEYTTFNQTGTSKYETSDLVKINL